MFRECLLWVVLALLILPSVGFCGASMEVISTNPASPAVLEPGQHLYVKFRYDSGGAEAIQTWVRQGDRNVGCKSHPCGVIKNKTGEYEGYFYFDDNAVEVKSLKLMMYEVLGDKKRKTIFTSSTPVDFKWKAPPSEGAYGYIAPGASVKITNRRLQGPVVLEPGESLKVPFQYEAKNSKSVTVRTWLSKKKDGSRPSGDKSESSKHNNNSGDHFAEYHFDGPGDVGKITFRLTDNDTGRVLIQYAFPVDVTVRGDKNKAGKQPGRIESGEEPPLRIVTGGKLDRNDATIVKKSSGSELIDAAIAKKYGELYEGVWYYEGKTIMLEYYESFVDKKLILRAKCNKNGELEFSFLNRDSTSDLVFEKCSVDQHRANVYFKLENGQSVMYSLVRQKDILTGTVHSSMTESRKVTFRKLKMADAIEVVESDSRLKTMLSQMLRHEQDKAIKEKREKEKCLERLKVSETRQAQALKKYTDIYRQYEELYKQYSELNETAQKNVKESYARISLMEKAIAELRKNNATLESQLDSFEKMNEELSGTEKKYVDEYSKELKEETKKTNGHQVGIENVKINLEERYISLGKNSLDNIKNLQQEIKSHVTKIENLRGATGSGDQVVAELFKCDDDKALYAAVIKKYPGTVAAMAAQAGMAFLSLVNGDYDQVLAEYEKLVNGYKELPRYGHYTYIIPQEYYERGKSAMKKKAKDAGRTNFALALKLWKKVDDKDLDSRLGGATLYVLGRCYGYTGDMRKGIECFEKLISDYPKSEYVGGCRFIIPEYATTLKKDPAMVKEADALIEKHLTDLVEKHPTIGYYRQSLGKLARFHNDKGQYAKALKRYEQLAEIKEERPGRYDRVIAECREKLGLTGDEKNKSGSRNKRPDRSKAKPFDGQGRSENVTIRVRGKITRTKVPGYIDVGDQFQIVAVIDSTKTDQSDYYKETAKYHRGLAAGVVSWELKLLDGSTGSYKGAKMGAASGRNWTITTFDHSPGRKDQFGISPDHAKVVSENLGESVFYSCGVRIWDKTGLALNDTGKGQTLAELTRNYQIVKNWTPEHGGDFDFNIRTNGTGSDGANGVVESVVIISEKN